jgi:hypothetical protein
MTSAYEDRPSAGRRITVVTRRDIFDYIRTADWPWHGHQGEIGFLSRLYDLDDLPSDDYRFATAREDIYQHLAVSLPADAISTRVWEPPAARLRDRR